MEELNGFSGVEVVEDKGHDTLTIVNMGDTIALSQVDEEGRLHQVIVSMDQAAAVMAFFGKVLG